MVTGDHPLAGVWAKIRRAEMHVSEFDQLQRAFLESYPVVVTVKEDSSTGRHKLIIQDIKPTPDDLALSIGDAIHNLRASLDLLACQLVKLGDNNHDCDNNISFPISHNSKGYLKKLDGEQIQLMGQSAIAILKELQPYEHGKDHYLWVIHHLDIQDKHKLLLVTLPSISHWSLDVAFTPSVSVEGSARVSYDVPLSRVNDFYLPKIGDEISEIIEAHFSGGEEGNLGVHLQIKGHIALDAPGFLQTQSAVDDLLNFVTGVKNTVELFRPLFPH